jgi:predicted pyridoxine 5'-phosphate oxidase superfamily flavin-nucleotide-binding protein
MSRAFADITFTPSVKDVQQRYGSRLANTRFELAETRGDKLTEDEAAFIAERDSFYQATVAENGWPYVQHRGGPRGFLKVLDEQTLAYADFRGNRQYLSVGNISNDDRVALILIDYVNGGRLKIWARARIVETDADPQLVDALTMPEYRARIERGVILHVEAVEWNCPQHITPRFSEAEVKELVAPLLAEIAELKAALQGA